MAISQLSLTDFRNLRSTTLDFNSRINLISGDNGSGKTSLLEALYVLCQARSFRTNQLKQCVRHGKNGFLLFGRFDGFKAGLSKRDSQLDIHVDGEAVRRRSDLVRRAPISILNADSFDIIDGPPQSRRAFVDWCLFHVEQSYADAWSRFQHALRQRNRLLRSRQDPRLLDYWDEYLLEPSREISAWRKSCCQQLNAIIGSELNSMLEGIPLDISYRAGWPAGSDPAEALLAGRERDIRLGFTGTGIHRDDIELESNGNPAAEILSRGQGKRVCLALVIASLRLVDASRQHRIILLIDDLNSELDPGAQERVYGQLESMDLQLFIANIDQAVPDALRAKEFRLFHVEHGTIKPRKIS